tara:strand:+ start:154 stop:471 length:318 start_codon:yes stop_codon:yes gene_type:complete
MTMALTRHCANIDLLTERIYMKIKEILHPATKLPFTIMLKDPKSKFAMEDVCNPYSGQMCKLPRYAVEVYKDIRAAEVKEDWTKMEKGLEWFSKNFTDQYYVLLD